MKRRSRLRQSLIFLSVGILMLYYFLVFLISVLFMEPYYLHKVEMSLIDAYHTLEHGEYDIVAVSHLEESNLTFLIADRETDKVLYNSRPQRPDMEAWLVPAIREYTEDSPDGYYITTGELMEHTTAGAEYSSGQRVSLGGVTENYVVEISTYYASIAQSTAISMQFSLIVGLLVMVLAILAFSRMSAVVTGPITQITSIANQIAHLDFSQKCNVSMGGEIGDMAESVNTMSDFMQSYITKLQEANEQLKADILQKQEHEEARRNLVANLSHDLKTPIGLISGYADGLRGGMAKTDQEVREYCDVIYDESDRMMTMIQRMMELFRLESGTVELQNEMFNLSELLVYVTDIFAVEMERDGIQLSEQIPEELYVYTDYFAAEQVITNYMQNAMTHINSGRKISLNVEDTGGFYRVSLFNSSAPIPEEELPRIWESFYRLDKSRKRSSSRESGLGLSIVKRNMELLGCDYGAKNVKEGVVFWADFPKLEQNTEQSDESETD